MSLVPVVIFSLFKNKNKQKKPKTLCIFALTIYHQNFPRALVHFWGISARWWLVCLLFSFTYVNGAWILRGFAFTRKHELRSGSSAISYCWCCCCFFFPPSPLPSHSLLSKTCIQETDGVTICRFLLLISNIFGQISSLCISWFGNIGGSVFLLLLRQLTDATMAEKRHLPHV